MPRKTETIVVSDSNRDSGKKFLLTEMPADQAERWAVRLLLAAAANGAQIPDGALEAGAAALPALGLRVLAMVPEHAALPLLDEMMGCVKYQPPNDKIAPQAILSGENSQIEEVSTRFKLRLALLELHTGFSVPGVSLTTATK